MKFSNMLSRALMLLVAVCLVMGQVGDAEAAKKKRYSKRSTSSQSQGVRDARYAAIIMNPITGEVYHQQNADGTRYPASLTKMMTLYLLFEALDKGRTTLDARMDISTLATRQPQTNLSLSAGDTISVETAIKALVVRSANDVAVVVAEALAGDVDEFADQMTRKARALGMRNTVFQNPNGLPNRGQVTTARDMAKLGIALKRDFPRYYRYFNTLQFSHNGVTYYTHNRVMLRYAGVDGIKTGYIGASGFNLVTSVRRGGRPLVGVVMGGASGRWRDNRMIELLDSSYQTIAQRGAARGRFFPENLPLPKAGQGKAVGVNAPATASLADEAMEPTLEDQTLPEAMEAEDGGESELPAPERAVVAKTPPFALERRNKVILSVPPAPLAEAVEPMPELATPSASRVIRVGDNEWGIQVGAFSTQDLAVQAVRNAERLAAKPLANARMAVANPTGDGLQVHRARVENLTQLEARNACKILIRNNSPCFIYRVVP